MGVLNIFFIWQLWWGCDPDSTKIRNLKMNVALSDERAIKKKVSASSCKLSSLTNFDCNLLSLKKLFLFDSKILTSVLFGFFIAGIGLDRNIRIRKIELQPTLQASKSTGDSRIQQQLSIKFLS